MEERHTATSLKKKVLEIMNEWEIAYRCVAIVHDNASNTVLATRELSSHSICCFAHLLQLVLNTILEENSIKPKIIESSSIVHFKHLNIATVALRKKQIQLCLENHKLNDSYMHPKTYHRLEIRSVDNKDFPVNDLELHADFWRQNAQASLGEKLLRKLNTNIAKNVIMFLGDGMSIPTLKASRVYLGQLHNQSGEETELSFEKFPITGLSKTYCVNKQVPDSACTSTAYLGGVKSNEGTLGVTAAVKLNDCDSSLVEENRVSSIAKWSQDRGKKTGIVTTTRITHASPAGAYAHSANRDWESDSDGVDPNCKDIAYQLVHEEVGSKFNVILGGGRRNFLPKSVIDEDGETGSRSDGENLIQSWMAMKGNSKAKYVWNRKGLLNVSNDTEYLLGLFESDHCKYHLDADEADPSLAEMTETAINTLSHNNRNGYFLFVEGGRIDHAHHDTKAHKALDETVEFHKAIQAAVDLTNEEDTLIVVTSDHAHTMSVSGYGQRGNDIFGSPGTADDALPYATLSYANGPGYRKEVNGKRPIFRGGDSNNNDYMFPATVPLEFETHGGDDVAIFAKGPWSHLLTGVIEQHLIPHVMAYASCVGDGLTLCDESS
ncbi:Alkaline phosphatase [Popillia japonica]|uniref:alkaline phosphatase n=1 Tax=Popillia japonica TaxID=7064 RepID=A0AAW1MDZ3_POPJA